MTDNLHDIIARLERFGAAPDKINPVSRTLSLTVRPAFIAAPGKTLVWGDFSAIEARVLPWLAGSRRAEKKLDIFRENDKDPSRPDIYIATACDLTGGDAELCWAAYRDKTHPDHKAMKKLRQAQGKVPELSLGFGGGLGALQAMATNYGVYLDDVAAKKMIDGWREANGWAKAFWDQLWEAATSAVERPGEVFSAGRVAYVYDAGYLGGTLLCGLPSGRTLKYPRIKWEKRPRIDKATGKPLLDHNGEPELTWQLTYWKGYGRSALWYGKCLAGDTLVATLRGWVRLDQVTTGDYVWDGDEWTQHDGLLFQGKKLTIPVDGVRMTPTHKVLTRDGWRKAKDTDGLDREGVWLPRHLAPWSNPAARETFKVGLPLRLRSRNTALVGRVDAVEQAAFAAVMRLRHKAATEPGETDARAVEASALRSVAVNDRSLPVAVASGLEKLRRAWHQGLSSLAEVRELLVGYAAELRAGVDAGPQEQRQGLLAGQLPVGDLQAASREPEAVYDLLNCGPRRRFVVLGDTGPMIVHNCAENITQAEAGSILRRTLVKLDDECGDWMPVVGHTHDEAVIECDEADEADAKATLKEIMQENDEWNDGLPLAVEITSSWYYSKSVE